MSRETKVGVVLGLVIVVIASAYFYSNARQDDEILLAAREGSGLPQIPLVDGRRTDAANAGEGDSKYRLPSGTGAAGAAPGAPMPKSADAPRGETARGAPPTVRSAAGDAAVKRDAGRETELAGDPRPTVSRGSWPPPAGGGANSTGTRGTDASLAGAGTGPGTVSPAPPEVGTTSLRTRASDALTWATQENLAVEPSSGSAIGADLREIGEGIRRGGDLASGGTASPNAPSRPPAAADRTREPASRMIEPVRTPAAGEESRAAGADAEAWPKRHVIAMDDTLYGLSLRYYGDGEGVGDIERANPEARARSLRPGVVLVIPARVKVSRGSDAARAEGPAGRAATGPRGYVVKDNETFYTIARKLYGDSGRWRELFELNRELVKGRPQRLRAGMELRLPDR